MSPTDSGQPPAGDAPRSGALLSPDRQYRYALWRHWSDLPHPRALVVIGLNPSTADEMTDDPTIRRCIGFAKREGCGRLVMLNLFALRATDPKMMRAHPAPIGDENDACLLEYSRARITGYDPLVVAAWGAHGSHLDRAAAVRALLITHGVTLQCLGRTQSGAPRHPLYLKGDSPLVPYAAAA